jgi:PIN domain nuclease of toxin-antitoxin system
MTDSIILDTHAFIWFVDGYKEMPVNIRKMIESSSVEKYISIASLWEIAIKTSLGKLNIRGDLSKVNDLVYLNGFKILPINFDDTFVVSKLPFFHRDPFDRILIAQAINYQMGIVSKDINFKSYQVKVIW